MLSCKRHVAREVFDSSYSIYFSFAVRTSLTCRIVQALHAPSKQVYMYYVQLELHSCSVKMANVCTRELRAKHTLYVYSAEQINFHQKGANVEVSLATTNSGGRELRLLTATLKVFIIKSCCRLIPNICHSKYLSFQMF